MHNLIVLFFSKCQVIRDIDENLYAAIICVVSGFFILLIFCYFGSTATSDFLKYSDCIYKLMWYDMPTKLQKTIIVVIGNDQRPIYFVGLRMFSLDLMTFTKATKYFSFFLYSDFLKQVRYFRF